MFKILNIIILIKLIAIVSFVKMMPTNVLNAKNNAQTELFTDPDQVIQGDIAVRLPKGIEKNANKAFQSGTKWENGIIPYVIHSSIREPFRTLIAQSMRVIEHQTKNCIRFVPHDYNYYAKAWLHIVQRNGCWSWVGQSRGEQWLSLAQGCFTQSTIVHELLHAIGFWHEQGRPDRDSHVQIHWNNINRNNYREFEVKSDEIDTLGAPYDYYSIMHYKFNTFARNPMYPTITPLDPQVNLYQLGRRSDLSELDVLKIRKYYNCDYYPW